MPTIADHILDLLRHAGIDHVYCSTRCRDLLTGSADGPGRMRLITVPDGGAAIAASAEAQLTGRPAVCVGAGPGVLELIDGLAEAHHIGVPVVAVVLADPGTPAGPGSRYRGSLAALPLFAGCSAHVVVLDAPQRTSQLLNSALHVARDTNDVAVLAVPSSPVGLDVAFRPASPEAFLDARGVSVPAANVVQLAQMLNSAGRVAFLAGAGVRGPATSCWRLPAGSRLRSGIPLAARSGSRHESLRCGDERAPRLRRLLSRLPRVRPAGVSRDGSAVRQLAPEHAHRPDRRPSGWARALATGFRHRGPDPGHVTTACCLW